MGISWGLWPKPPTQMVPAGFQSQLWIGEESHDHILEKQVLAMYQVLQQVGGCLQKATVTVKTAYP